jgi:hypothetical protein
MASVLLSSGRFAPRTNLIHMPHVTSLEPVLQRIRGEFHESPGLRLTHWQFQRLWNLDADQARLVIEQLVQTRFLRGARDGTFVRCEL